MREPDFEEKLARLRRWLAQSRRTVFFGGAGVSTDSGLADFRSASSGLYRRGPFCGLPPEKILSRDFFLAHPAEFYEYYRTRLLKLEAEPNIVHRTLAAMERAGRLEAVLTQNADGLHQRAGSRRVLDLHGNVYRNSCMACGKAFSAEEVAHGAPVPRCECGGLIRPGIVLFGEVPDMTVVLEAVGELRACELLLVGGTSLQVSSAQKLLNGPRKGRMVILNEEPTPFDAQADMVLRGPLRDVFSRLAGDYPDAQRKGETP